MPMKATNPGGFPLDAAMKVDLNVHLLHQRVETLQTLGLPLDQAGPFLLEPIDGILENALAMRERITLS